ncbi:hypothetical protein BU25DRAFT_13174 [Macroventuria anomochaeta]|uniref:Uncharacterized protein n=1 Tax=Macroventuria anomochaeta TaxID=301207 RepID=A0ACB6SHU9_9PLEO|nr:uncharacterized protein BU25DRAFT_13174 [Macroventuria anomochaeta]KAF2633811.1 hypothetical protein BU25DRAFT_13174 [Macroventuria anomochaeta]
MPSDTFFIIIEERALEIAYVRKSVTKIIDRLYLHPSCTPYLQYLLRTIKTKMLVVHHDLDNAEDLALQQSTSNSLLVPDQPRVKRSSSGAIFQALVDIAQRWDGG